MEEGRRGSLHVCFGDRHTSLFDEFERLTIEIQLNRTILRRSYSAPSPAWFARPPLPLAQQRQTRGVEPGRRSWRVSRTVWRWLRPVFGARRRRHGKEGAKPRETRACPA